MKHNPQLYISVSIDMLQTIYVSAVLVIVSYNKSLVLLYLMGYRSTYVQGPGLLNGEPPHHPPTIHLGTPHHNTQRSPQSAQPYMSWPLM